MATNYNVPFEVWAYDQPHHGRSGLAEVKAGEKPTGEVDSIGENVKHLHNFVELISRERPGRPIILLGHSMGGLVVASFLQKNPNEAAVRGAILSAPALRTFDGISDDFQENVIGVIGRQVPAKTPAIPDFLKNKYFFQDPSLSKREINNQIEDLKADPLVHDGLHTIPTAQALINGIEAFRSGHPQRYSVPVLLVHSAGDRITNPQGTIDFHDEILRKDPDSKSELHILQDHSFHDLPGLYSQQFGKIIAPWLEKIRTP